MIEADSARLGEFLKNSGGNVPANLPSKTLELSKSPLVEKTQDVGQSVDTFVKLLESVNKLLSNDLINSLMSRGVERKANNLNYSPPPQEIPEGFLPVNNTSQSEEKKEEVKSFDYEEKSNILINGLENTIKNLVEMNKDRTIKEIYEEFEQEQVKQHFKEQIKMLLEN